MKKAVLFIAGLFFTLTATATETQDYITGNGDKVKQKREISDFNAINITGPFNVELVSGYTGTVSLEGAENIVSQLEVSVQDGVLNISLPKGKKFRAHKNNKINITIPYKLVNQVRLKGSGNIGSKNTITNDVKIELEGSGSVKLNIYNVNSQALLMGSGTVKLTGTATNFSCKVVGSGSIIAENLNSELVDAWVSGSGNVNVNSDKEIIGRISGSGTIAFSGNPQKRDLKRTGSGDFSML